MIHVFHGFLGSPDDFQFLNAEFKIRLYDLYTTSIEDIIHQVKPEDSLIGYSLGGRLAMELAIKLKFNIQKLVLINSHPGLQDIKELPEREKFESLVIKKLTTENPENFLRWWNMLPIFSHDLPLKTLSEEKKLASINLFEKHKLSCQENYLPDLSHYKSKVSWIIGTEDSKYVAMARNSLVPNDFNVIFMPGGHRLFQQGNDLIARIHEAMK